MPDIQVTDQLDKPIDIKIDLSHPSSLFKYLKTELLHLAVLPDFLARKDSLLTHAAEKPIWFQAKAQHSFQLGLTQPEVDITPGAGAIIRVNASPGTNLFSGDSFPFPAEVPPNTGYVSVGFQGSLTLGSGSAAGNLEFGFSQNSSIKLEYFKAFPLGQGEPTLADALGKTISSYVIPADLSDLNSLAVNDIATVSGQGSLTVSGGMQVTVIPNPLASVDLPLGVGTIAVHAGPALGLSTSFTISGSYQLRVRRRDAETVELSIAPEQGTTLESEFSASAGVTASLDGTDLIVAVLGCISPDPVKDKEALESLQASEMATLTSTIKNGLDYSLQACVNAALSATTDRQAAFEYALQPAQINPKTNLAIHKALKGDLSLLTQMESSIQPGGVLAPGLKMLNSILSKTTQYGATLRINLLGILNYLTVSELIRNSEIVKDVVTGDITIKETVTGNTISAVVDPQDRAEALRKVMFNSVLATTSYRAGKAIAMPDLNCEQVHFALHQNTKEETVRDYLNWFTALNLLPPQARESTLAQLTAEGLSTCVLRTAFGNPDCDSMFFDKHGALRPKQHYLEIGRQALRALLDPKDHPNDRLRYQIVDDTLWPKALTIGAANALGSLVGLSVDDPRVEYLRGDVLDITSWADAMVQAGALIQDMRTFVGKSDPAALFKNNEFTNKRDTLQKKLAAMVKASKTRFEEPWGMVCLFWAAGSPHTAYGKTVTKRGTLERGTQHTRIADRN